MKKSIPDFTHEKQYWQEGVSAIAGVDEAGMGALAGPVVAAAVIMDPDMMVDGVRDSKTLTAKKREKLEQEIRARAISWATGEASVQEITALNIRNAAHLAMRRALDSLLEQPDMALVDGTPATIHPAIFTVNIIDGDALSHSIAAASILAKVRRDAILCEIDREFPDYGFASHKGYGSKVHMEALRRYGICKHHRPTYAPIAKILTKKA